MGKLAVSDLAHSQCAGDGIFSAFFCLTVNFVSSYTTTVGQTQASGDSHMQGSLLSHREAFSAGWCWRQGQAGGWRCRPCSQHPLRPVKGRNHGIVDRTGFPVDVGMT